MARRNGHVLTAYSSNLRKISTVAVERFNV